jgi:hypothetical protein
LAFVERQLMGGRGQAVLERVLHLLDDDSVPAARRDEIRDELGYKLKQLIDP